MIKSVDSDGPPSDLLADKKIRESHGNDPLHPIKNEDEFRLAKLGYQQEVKRIFGTFTNFGLAASMISVILGIIPLYTYQLSTGGPVVMVWSWVIVGFFTVGLVGSLAEICSAYPTMGALYYWAFRLGGPSWGRFASWTAGWCNLLGQIAGVASGGYSGAYIISNIVANQNNYAMTNLQILGVYLLVLIFAGIVNTFSETMLTCLCYISVGWHIAGVLMIVIWMMAATPSKLQPAEWVFFHFENDSDFTSQSYVAAIGVLAAASTFTGYDTAAHVAEETTCSHQSTPLAMMGSILNAEILGLILILGMNACITDISALTDPNNTEDAYTILWQDTVGTDATTFFLIVVFVAIECSNCANLTSASRMVYSFARDGGLPPYFYNMNKDVGGPLRAIWLCVFVSFLMGVPGLENSEVLGALFSLTATGLYASYMIPILLRVTVSRDTFVQAEFNLGKYSIIIGWVSVAWCIIMVVVLCLPQASPINATSMNYSPIMLGGVLIFAWAWWLLSARFWFKGAKAVEPEESLPIEPLFLNEHPTSVDELRQSLMKINTEVQESLQLVDVDFMPSFARSTLSIDGTPKATVLSPTSATISNDGADRKSGARFSFFRTSQVSLRGSINSVGIPEVANPVHHEL